MQTVAIDPKTLSADQAYGFLISLVVPRPIALVSTVSESGVPNLAPFSYFTVGGSSPLSLVISVVTPGRGGVKDTLRNIEQTDEFVVHLVERRHFDDMNQTSQPIASEESEWDLTRFEPVACDLVKPPRIAQVSVAFECRKFQVVAHGSQPGSANYIIGEVVRAHVADSIWNNGTIQYPPTIARLGGADYFDLAVPEMFQVKRP